MIHFESPRKQRRISLYSSSGGKVENKKKERNEKRWKTRAGKFLHTSNLHNSRLSVASRGSGKAARGNGHRESIRSNQCPKFSSLFRDSGPYHPRCIIYRASEVQTLRAAHRSRSLVLRNRRYYPSNRSKTTDSFARRALERETM